jgi:cytochrome o ubiquinol oxidase subunit II
MMIMRRSFPRLARPGNDSGRLTTRSQPVRRRLRASAILGSLFLLGGCTGGIFDPAGPIASANRLILLDSLAIMLAIVIPTIVAGLAFAWWFRASNTKAKFRPDFVYSGRLELITWSIPIMIILFLGGVIWVGSHQLDPAEPIQSKSPPVQVQVVSLDWKWLFIYPELGVASVNQLAIPTGVPVRFALTSASVMNAFFVPQLGSLIYTMNGMVTQLNLQADRTGEFWGESAMISGDGFSDMHFNVRALSPQDFDAWVNTTRQHGDALTVDQYRTLERQSSNVQPFTYRAVDTGLFQTIVTQKIPSAPGPDPTRSGVDVHPVSTNGGK